MITVYTVYDDQGHLGTYIEKDRAESHRDHAWKFCRRADEFAVMIEMQVNELSRQPVYTTGDALGFQFGRTTMGSATFIRTIQGLHQTTDGSILGWTTIHGRTVTVQYHDHYHTRRYGRATFNAWHVIAHD